jgi:hypothetical protein
MNHPHSKEDAALDAALKHWRVEDTLPPRFEERVWKRIAQGEAVHPSWWALFLKEICAGLAKPSLAAVYLALLLMTGLAGGYYHAQVVESHTLEDLSTRYVQMVDPYQNRH